MALNCTQLDGAYRQLEAFATGTDAGVVALIVALGAVSGVLLTHGERLVRPLGGALAGLGGALVVVGSQAAGFACELRVAAAGVAGVLLAPAPAAKTGLLGAAGLGVGHLATSACLDDSGAPFELMGLSGYYSSPSAPASSSEASSRRSKKNTLSAPCRRRSAGAGSEPARTSSSPAPARRPPRPPPRCSWPSSEPQGAASPRAASRRGGSGAKSTGGRSPSSTRRPGSSRSTRAPSPRAAARAATSSRSRCTQSAAPSPAAPSTRSP